MKFMLLLMGAVVFATSSPARAEQDPAFSTYALEDQVFAITNRLAQDHACAMNAFIEAALLAATFSPEAIATVKARGTLEGAWSVLPSSLCKIEMPRLNPAFDKSFYDRFIAPAEPWQGEQDPGCFLTTSGLFESLQEQGLSEDEAHQQYLAFMADQIRLNSMRFYAESPLSTPVGFLDVNRDCGALPYRAAMNRSHALLVEHFDSFVRRNAASVPCEEGISLMSPSSLKLWDELTEGQNKNAWLHFEVSVVAMGAGWVEGMSSREKGTLRPPLCHYP